MRYVFEVSETEAVTLKILDEESRVVRELPRVLKMPEACRLLGRSRRHLYRYIARGWLRPAAKFSGELFFDVNDLRSLQRGKQARRRSLPKSMAVLFPEYDLRTLEPDRDADLILARTLERGTPHQIQWALQRYPPARRKQFLKTEGRRLLTERAFHFWTWLWGVRPPSGPFWRDRGRAWGGVA